MTIHDDREHPLAEAAQETIAAWRATVPWGKWTLGIGLVLFVLFSAIRLPDPSNVIMPLLRTLSLATVMLGAFVNARGSDAFFRQVYSEGCIFGVLVCSVLLFATAEFRIDLAQNAVSLLLLATLAGMAISFVRLRRA